MTRTREPTRAIVTLSLKLTEEVVRRKRAERSLEHESKALQDAFREIDALKSDNKRLRDDVDITCNAIKTRIKDIAELNAKNDALFADLRNRVQLLAAIRTAASLFPARYRKQIQQILEAK